MITWSQRKISNVPCFLNYSWQRRRCIFISYLFLVQFRYVANLFYLKIGKSSYSAQWLQRLFWNRWNQESAGRVYFNISWEKPAHAPDTSHVQPLSCKLEWTNQKHTIVFCWNQSETILLQAVPQSSWSLSTTCTEELWVKIESFGWIKVHALWDPNSQILATPAQSFLELTRAFPNP